MENFKKTDQHEFEYENDLNKHKLYEKVDFSNTTKKQEELAYILNSCNSIGPIKPFHNLPQIERRENESSLSLNENNEVEKISPIQTKNIENIEALNKISILESKIR